MCADGLRLQHNSSGPDTPPSHHLDNDNNKPLRIWIPLGTHRALGINVPVLAGAAAAGCVAAHIAFVQFGRHATLFDAYSAFMPLNSAACMYAHRSGRPWSTPPHSTARQTPHTTPWPEGSGDPVPPPVPPSSPPASKSKLQKHFPLVPPTPQAVSRARNATPSRGSNPQNLEPQIANLERSPILEKTNVKSRAEGGGRDVDGPVAIPANGQTCLCMYFAAGTRLNVAVCVDFRLGLYCVRREVAFPDFDVDSGFGGEAWALAGSGLGRCCGIRITGWWLAGGTLPSEYAGCPSDAPGVV
ncbi:hypothetical protein DFH09DRAFT_1318990 [Mycena vulgaris]|nr:hypothetical protein DFH09DRAFT_1318990 [Mycena vulgaris]